LPIPSADFEVNNNNHVLSAARNFVTRQVNQHDPEHSSSENLNDDIECFTSYTEFHLENLFQFYQHLGCSVKGLIMVSRGDSFGEGDGMHFLTASIVEIDGFEVEIIMYYMDWMDECRLIVHAMKTYPVYRFAFDIKTQRDQMKLFASSFLDQQNFSTHTHRNTTSENHVTIMNQRFLKM